MKCAKCGTKLTAAICSSCGYSNKSDVWYLEQLPAQECVIGNNVQKYTEMLKDNIAPVELAANLGDPDACKVLTDYYYRLEKYIWDEEPELYHTPRHHTEKIEAGWFAQMLVKFGGEPTANQAYILARELQYAYDYAGPTVSEYGNNRELIADMLKWMTFAAEQDHPLAQNFMLKCYLKGKFVEKDAAKEEYWRKRIHERYRDSIDSIPKRYPWSR